MIGEVRQMRIMIFWLRIMMLMHTLIIHMQNLEFSFHAKFKVSLGLIYKLHFHEQNLHRDHWGCGLLQGCCYNVAEVLWVFVHYYVVARVFRVVARWLFTSKESPQSERYADILYFVCVCMFMWFMRTQICIMTWVWHRYYKENVIYEDNFSVPIIQVAYKLYRMSFFEKVKLHKVSCKG